MRAVGIITAVLVGCWGLAPPVLADKASTLVLSFGVVPQQPVTELVRGWTPMLTHLSSTTGYTLEFKTAQDIGAFERRVNAREFDFVYMNPLHYITYQARGYQAVARERDSRLVGIVVVSKAGSNKNLKDLHGTTVAFPSPFSFAATILPRMSLKGKAITVSPKYVVSHESVYLTVARDIYPAGGGILSTYEQLDPAVRDQLRILWKSPPYTPHPIAAHKRVPKEVVQRVVTALLHLADSPEGMTLLKGAGFRGFTSANDSDYGDIRSLQANMGESGFLPLTK